jgi:hypothetical protein
MKLTGCARAIPKESVITAIRRSILIATDPKDPLGSISNYTEPARTGFPVGFAWDNKQLRGKFCTRAWK